MPDGLSALAAGRYAAFAVLAVVLPGIAVQRLLRVRAERALVLPLGLVFCAFAYWASLVAEAPQLFLLLVLGIDATLLRTRVAFAEGPSFAGALPAWLAVALCFAASVFRQDRVDATGAFLAGGVQVDDAAFHVGLAFELAQGYPPQVPGLSGFTLDYHLGAPLVRAAALRFAAIHPYDALARFENTLYALALILSLRGAAHALAAPPLGVALAGFAVLASDLSFLLAPGRGIEWWVGVFEGGTGLQSLFHANSLVPALALALGAPIALRRGMRGEGRGYIALAAVAGFACAFFKVFVAAQLLLALAAAALAAGSRRAPLALLGAVAAGLLPLVLGPGGRTMLLAFEPLRVPNDARADLGLEGAVGPGLLLWLLPWLALSLGLRIAGLPRALRALRSGDAAAVSLAAFALAGWPLGLLFRVSPIEAGLRQRPFNEALYFFESSGFALWVFAALAVSASRFAARRPAAALLGCALLALPSSLQFVWQEALSEPRRIPPAAVRATLALARETAPLAVVLVKPERQRYPPPPLVAGRRVPFTRLIPFFAQLAPRAALRARYQRAASFFTTEDPQEARAIARELGASALCLFGADDVRFPKGELLETFFEEAGARVYRIR